MENNPKKSKALIITFIVVLLLLIGVYLLFSNSDKIFGTKGAINFNKIFSPLLGTSKTANLNTIDTTNIDSSNTNKIETICLNGTTNPPTCTTIAGSCINGTDNPPTCTTIGGKCQNSANNPPICTTKSVNGKNVCLNGATNPDKCTTKIIKDTNNKDKEVCISGADNIPACTTVEGKCQNGANNPDLCTTTTYNPNNPENPNYPNTPYTPKVCDPGLEGSNCDICSNGLDPLKCTTKNGQCTNTATNPDECNKNDPNKTCLYGGTYPDKCNPMPQGNLSNNSSCIILAGSNSCTIQLNWNLKNIIGNSTIVTTPKSTIVTTIKPKITQKLATLQTSVSGTTSVDVKYTNDVTFPSRKYTLINQGTTLDELNIQASCAPNSSWNGNICYSSNIPTPGICNNGAYNYPTCTPPGTCSNNAINYPTCDILSDGSCVAPKIKDVDTNQCINSGDCISPKIINNGKCESNQNNNNEGDNGGGSNNLNYCPNDALDFTPAEFAALQELLKEYYALGDSVKTEGDLVTVNNDIDKADSLINKTDNLITQCIAQVDKDPNYIGPKERRTGNPYFDPHNDLDFSSIANSYPYYAPGFDFNKMKTDKWGHYIYTGSIMEINPFTLVKNDVHNTNIIQFFDLINNGAFNLGNGKSITYQQMLKDAIKNPYYTFIPNDLIKDDLRIENDAIIESLFHIW